MATTKPLLQDANREYDRHIADIERAQSHLRDESVSSLFPGTFLGGVTGGSVGGALYSMAEEANLYKKPPKSPYLLGGIAAGTALGALLGKSRQTGGKKLADRGARKVQEPFDDVQKLTPEELATYDNPEEEVQRFRDELSRRRQKADTHFSRTAKAANRRNKETGSRNQGILFGALGGGGLGQLGTGIHGLATGMGKKGRAVRAAGKIGLATPALALGGALLGGLVQPKQAEKMTIEGVDAPSTSDSIWTEPIGGRTYVDPDYLRGSS